MPGEQGERHEIRALEAAIGRCLSGGRDFALGQPVELVGGLEDDGEVVRVGQQVLLERGREGREALVDLGQPRLRIVLEACPGLGLLGVVTLDEVALLRIRAPARRADRGAS